jgi:hypothetical protein
MAGSMFSRYCLGMQGAHFRDTRILHAIAALYVKQWRYGHDALYSPTWDLHSASSGDDQNHLSVIRMNVPCFRGRHDFDGI